MNKQLEKVLLSHTNSSHILNIELIQELWSGYGQLSRVNLDQGSVILKLIKFPKVHNHSRGWNSNISHQRKVKSYQVELNWYQYFNDETPLAYSPKLITSGKLEDSQYLVLEDLRGLSFSPKTSIDWQQAQLCLKWLANFHAKYLKRSPKDLWSTGTYWHLETRPEELAVLEDQDLKRAAPIIDTKLNSSTFKTLVHGDAKLANFLFNQSDVSAVDFQYVGGGIGIKDVAYFLSSIYGENELEHKSEQCLDYYFNELNLALALYNHQFEYDRIEKEWRELYPYAWCDFYRFLQGWSPGHPKINSYSEKMKQRVLKWI
jgi:thiamine kinase-like enzyme